ncbi:uncharacterized protein RAG0_00115 [Rhynchosporium agropyri]|uniref:Uncharacterized protein n=1 Tax=Rhynchosporium agropyri TaxID=914238 RepID=A0A1E1JRH5_9HELO|nr:uncharacterized protein RAG0_00115 [Rhynchosporium agropyri]
MDYWHFDLPERRRALSECPLQSPLSVDESVTGSGKIRFKRIDIPNMHISSRTGSADIENQKERRKSPSLVSTSKGKSKGLPSRNGSSRNEQERSTNQHSRIPVKPPELISSPVELLTLGLTTSFQEPSGLPSDTIQPPRLPSPNET